MQTKTVATVSVIFNSRSAKCKQFSTDIQTRSKNLLQSWFFDRHCFSNHNICFSERVQNKFWFQLFSVRDQHSSARIQFRGIQISRPKLIFLSLLFLKISISVSPNATKITNKTVVYTSNVLPYTTDALYALVVVGHSLGAGTAPLLAVLLRQEHPTLQCYAFSPPGGLMSHALVQHSQSFVTAVVVGDDVIPRIGLNQFQRLRTEIISILDKVTNIISTVLLMIVLF